MGNLYYKKILVNLNNFYFINLTNYFLINYITIASEVIVPSIHSVISFVRLITIHLSINNVYWYLF